jgi:hypothetical protein
MKAITVLRSTSSLAALLASVFLACTAFAQSEKVIFDFSPQGFQNLSSNLISDAAGNFYGADGNGGVFKVTPTSGGGWASTQLSTIGGLPLSLAVDANGNIFGTTLNGGIVTNNCPAGCGMVFELSPPAQPGNPWTQAILYEFTHGPFSTNNGPRPTGLTIGAHGVLYGAAEDGGNSEGDGLIFQLRPPGQSGGAWAYQVLYGFQGNTDGAYPTGYFLVDKSLNLYGTTKAGGTTSCYQGCGTIFELSPPSAPGAPWTKTILLNFGINIDGYLPNPGLIMDKKGNLYGTTYFGFSGSGQGTAFELSPPAQTGGAWTETVLHWFSSSPDGSGPLSLSFGSAGSLYGATWYGGSEGGGAVFELTPPAQSGGEWTETILHNFPFSPDGSNDGIQPNSNLIYRSGAFYGATLSGGPVLLGQCNTGCGVIYKVLP